MTNAWQAEAPKLTADTSMVTPAKPTHRSRVTNGSSLFADVDGRTARARRLRDVLDELLAEIGDASEAQQSLARRAASLSVWCEEQEAALARGEAVDVAALVTAGNSVRRLLRDLGIKRPQTGARP